MEVSKVDKICIDCGCVNKSKYKYYCVKCYTIYNATKDIIPIREQIAEYFKGKTYAKS